MDHLSLHIHDTLYVDDLKIVCKSQGMRFIRRKLKTATNRIIKLTNKNGFNIALDNTSCGHLCRSRDMHPHLKSSLEHLKLLLLSASGFWSYSLITLQLRKKCEQSLNLCLVYSNTSWREDHATRYNPLQSWLCQPGLGFFM